jgi:mannose-6-phosphate isomerase-like protein (cupin superfamily)
VVIGQNEQGRSAVVFDGTLPPATPNPNHPGVAGGQIWKESASLDIASQADQLDTFRDVSVPEGGTRFFWNELGPGVRTAMHATQTVEYHRVISGRIILELEDGEVEVKAGDTIVMRGVPHAWHNPSDTETWISFATMVDMRSSF